MDPEHRELTWKLLDTERRERQTTILFSTHYLDEAEPCDHVVLLSNGRAVSAGTPATLKASVGEEVVEVEGPDGDQLLPALRNLVSVQTTIKTERGYRVGICGPRDKLAGLAGVVPRLSHFTVRPVTLDDVYFARTEAAGGPSSQVR